MSIPSGITRADVLNGILRYQGNERGKFVESIKYDLLFENTHYPPKAILGLSTYRLLGAPLTPADFSGGEESTCFRILRSLGFEIVPKGDPVGWIFQGNPDQFDLEGYLRAHDEILWYVGQEHYRDRILPGQPVFFWKAKGKSGKESGIVAVGQILAKPEMLRADDASRPFARSGFDSEKYLRVRLRILSRRLGGDLIKKEKFLQDPVLQTLHILRQASGTNYPLTEAQVVRLQQITGNPRDLPDESELKEALQKQVRNSLKLSPQERKKRLAAAPKKPRQVTVITKAYYRNPDVIAEVLSQAKGVCGFCKKPAPFQRASDESPYLEVHHRLPLAEGGDDTVENSVALCPNCHRNEHLGMVPFLTSEKALLIWEK